MHTIHTSLPFANHALHFVEFDPASCHDHDPLQLPHYAQSLPSGHKCKAEHLAGRIVTVHTLRGLGLKTVPDIGTQRQPVWPQGLLSSISHSASTTLTVVLRQPTGIDTGAVFTPQTITELASSIVTHAEKELLANGSLSIEQVLTLAFSTKESAFKIARTSRQTDAGFMQCQIMVLQHNQMILRVYHQTCRV